MLKQLINFKQILYGLIIFFVVLSSVFNLFSFLVILAIISGFMVKELQEIGKSNKNEVFLGLMLISIAILSLVVVHLFKYGEYVIFWYFFSVFTFDVFAMYGGKIIGGRKLAENISPKKTLAGLFCGLYVSNLCAAAIFEYYIYEGIADASVFGYGIFFPTSLICIAAMFSDLLESKFKRNNNVKNSSELIPGHGGFLDRFDSLLLSAPLLLIMMII